MSTKYRGKAQLLGFHGSVNRWIATSVFKGPSKLKHEFKYLKQVHFVGYRLFFKLLPSRLKEKYTYSWYSRSKNHPNTKTPSHVSRQYQPQPHSYLSWMGRERGSSFPVGPSQQKEGDHPSWMSLCFMIQGPPGDRLAHMTKSITFSRTMYVVGNIGRFLIQNKYLQVMSFPS